MVMEVKPSSQQTVLVLKYPKTSENLAKSLKQLKQGSCNTKCFKSNRYKTKRFANALETKVKVD